MTGANLAAVIQARAQEAGWDDRAAFWVGDRAFTHGEVHDGAARTASLFADLGAGPGDRVLMAVDDGIEFVWSFLGALRLGAMAVPVNPRLTADDHRYTASDSGARVVVCSEDLAGRFPHVPAVIGVGGPGRLETRIQDRPPHPPFALSADWPAYAQYTSGTTGPPKAAVHRHHDPLVYFDAFAGAAIALSRDDVVLSVSKMYFAYGLGNSLFFPLLAGAAAILEAAAPRPDAVATLVRRHRVTVLFSVPTFYAHLVAGTGRDAFSSLRVAVSAGECLVPALAERARRSLGCPILDGLGSTEVGQTFVSNTLGQCRDGTVGRALPPYEISVLDDDGNQVAAGTPGTLWVRGPTVLLEYLGRPAATPGVLRGGWLCTGDRVAVDTDGFVHHHGRVDDMEMVGGISVAPREIEELLCRHEAVTEAAVAAVRDDSGASRLEAFVVLRPESGTEATVAQELVAMARHSLAPYKVPRDVRFVDALPRTPTGKLRRFVLRSATSAAGGPR